MRDVSGKRLLFWDDLHGELQPLLDLLGVVPGGRRYGQPRDHIRHDVPRADREELSRALQGGAIGMAYMGWADCRICGAMLGTRDFFGNGFIWPEKADHYVLVHDVWTPECGELLATVRRARRRIP